MQFQGPLDNERRRELRDIGFPEEDVNDLTADSDGLLLEVSGCDIPSVFGAYGVWRETLLTAAENIQDRQRDRLRMGGTRSDIEAQLDALEEIQREVIDEISVGLVNCCDSKDLIVNNPPPLPRERRPATLPADFPPAPSPEDLGRERNGGFPPRNLRRIDTVNVPRR